MPDNKLLSSSNNKGSILTVIFKVFSKIINRTTAMFTMITLLICFFGVIQKKNIVIDCRNCGSAAGEFPGGMLNSSVLMWFALFSVIISLVSMITDFMKKKNVNHVITMSVHFVLSYLTFFFIFIRGQLFTLYSDSIMFTGNSSWITGFALTIFFIGAYLIVFGIKFLFITLVDKRRNKKIVCEADAVEIQQDEN